MARVGKLGGLPLPDIDAPHVPRPPGPGAGLEQSVQRQLAKHHPDEAPIPPAVAPEVLPELMPPPKGLTRGVVKAARRLSRPRRPSRPRRQSRRSKRGPLRRPRRSTRRRPKLASTWTTPKKQPVRGYSASAGTTTASQRSRPRPEARRSGEHADHARGVSELEHDPRAGLEEPRLQRVGGAQGGNGGPSTTKILDMKPVESLSDAQLAELLKTGKTRAGSRSSTHACRNAPAGCSKRPGCPFPRRAGSRAWATPTNLEPVLRDGTRSSTEVAAHWTSRNPTLRGPARVAPVSEAVRVAEEAALHEAILRGDSIEEISKLIQERASRHGSLDDRAPNPLRSMEDGEIQELLASIVDHSSISRARRAAESCARCSGGSGCAAAPSG